MAKQKTTTPSPSLYGPARGREVLDPTPVAMPLGYEHPESIEETVARLLRSEQLARLAQQEGVETFDEFMNFGDESDDDPSTPHEEFWDPILQRPTTLAEIKELDRTLKGGGTVQFSERDALYMRNHLLRLAQAKPQAPLAEQSGPEAADPAPAAK